MKNDEHKTTHKTICFCNGNRQQWKNIIKRDEDDHNQW